MQQFYLITKEKELGELLGLTHDEIWEKGICLDDWDYFIVIPSKKSTVPHIWDRLLSGSCCNGWRYVKTSKGNFHVGGAYHA